VAFSFIGLRPVGHPQTLIRRVDPVNFAGKTRLQGSSELVGSIRTPDGGAVPNDVSVAIVE